MTYTPSPSWRWAAPALAGPLVAGAILGLRHGPAPALALGFGLTGIVAAVTLLVMPALYVAGVALGVRLTVGQTAAAAAMGLRALGLALLGLAPLGLLVAASASRLADAHLTGVALLTLAVVVGLRRLWAELPLAAGRPMLGHALFAGYALVAITIGGRLFVELADHGWRLP